MSVTEKAVMLARGLGTRLREPGDEAALDEEKARVAGRGLKALMPLNGRPFLDYAVDRLVRAGVQAVCLVVAPEADELRQAARRISRAARVSVSCAVQDKPLGTADAVLAAAGFVGRDPFLLTNGDNLFPVRALEKLTRAEGDGCILGAFDRDALVAGGNIAPERVRSFAVVRCGQYGRLAGIVEKPDRPEDYASSGRVLVSMNLYRFSPEVFEFCRSVEPDPRRGELELTAAVDALARSGRTPFRVVLCEGPVYDLTRRSDVPALEAAVKVEELCF